VTNRFTALDAAQNEVTPEDLWKGTNTVLLEVARETIGSAKSRKKKKRILDESRPRRVDLAAQRNFLFETRLICLRGVATVESAQRQAIIVMVGNGNLHVNCQHSSFS